MTGQLGKLLGNLHQDTDQDIGTVEILIHQSLLIKQTEKTHLPMRNQCMVNWLESLEKL
jgi:hypothetical protein